MAGRKSTAAMELAIGATIIAGIIILIVMLMAWGNTSSLLGRHYRVVVNMTNVGGLKEGAPVKMGGFQIGRVASIQIRSGGTDMEIVLDIDENRLLPQGSSAKVSTAGLVGDAFMEIIPGKSADMINRSATVAGAERLESSPLPDLSQLFTKVNEFGDQLTILTTHLNDVVGDAQFRKSLKSMAVNLDAVSYQANLILQRGQSVVDNIEKASQNVAILSDTLKGSVEKVTADIEKITTSALDIADVTKGTIGDVRDTIGDVRKAVEPLTDAIATAKEAIDTAKTTLTTTNDAVTKVRDSLDGITGKVNATLDTTHSAVAKVNDSLDGVTGKVNTTLDTAHDAIAKVRDTIGSVAGQVTSAMDTVKQTVEMTRTSVTKANDLIDNIHGGVSEARQAVQNTIGNPAMAADIRKTVSNINTVTGVIAQRRQAMEKLVENLGALSGNLNDVSIQAKQIIGNIEPTVIPNTLGSVNAAIASLTEVVEQIKKEPVLALSMNKAADRIVKMKFDEMSKQPQFRSSDSVLDEVNRWVRSSMQRGYVMDPSYTYEKRPYVMQERRPYMMER